MPLALLALAIAAFGIGTTEFVMMGLLPNVADDLGTSVPTAGHLVSAYAIGVVVGAPLLTALGTRVPRKRMLLALMGLFTLGNLASALAPGYETLLAGRFLAGLPHGAFFGLGAVVATRLVAPERRARAVASMFLGLTVATIVGVPLGTLLGQHLGWRSTFLVVTAIGLIAMAALARLIPQLSEESRPRLRQEVRELRRPQVLLAMATTIVGMASIFAVYTYLSSMMTKVTGFSDSAMTLVLALFGVGMTLGALIGGPLADRALRPTLYGALTGLTAMLGLFHFTAEHKATALASVVLIGMAGFLACTPLQVLVMEKASAAPTLAASSTQSAFNIANAFGAWAAGAAVSAGWGWTAPATVAAVLAGGGLVIAVAAGLLDRARPDRSESRVVATGERAVLEDVHTS
ncbi:MFS transporter [Streptomyces sp. A7024]|uniref:MFS transporter n=1 Tax=Streptomyces coryli TaxID=1128680 RepID=A0A6G4U4E6_9ACTN|nr:MFS transporter [Streptomyces coryli]NGN66157.1 MFS transporter [Streptomyces coryli]